MKDVEIAQHSSGKINNIPHSHNPNFTGRVDLLDRLQKALASGERAAFTQTSAITGLGGVGKTQLALEYYYRHADDYQVVWWVRSEEPATLADDFAGLAERLDLPEKPSQDQRITVEAVRNWLEQNDGWLLVFDNSQDSEDLNDYLPRTGKGHVIITSRNPNWGGTAKTLPVNVFSRDESVEFLKNRTGQEDGAEALAEALGDLPLALEQAGAYIEETGITLSNYLKRFQKEQEEVLKRGKPTSYPATVATTWEISFRHVLGESESGADLLHLCAFLAPDNIPKSLIIGGAEHLPEPLATAVTNQLKFDDAVAALKRYSLMTIAKEALSVHRLVQAVARDRLSEKEQKRWAEAAVRLVNDAFPAKSYDVRNRRLCSLLLPHALAASEHAERLEVASEATGKLLHNIGPYLIERAEYDGAKSVLERGLKIRELVYGSDHPEVARTLGNLGLALQAMGDYEVAKKYHERALKIKEHVYGSNHPEVARTAEGLGLALHGMGDYESAKEYLQRALEIDETVYGPDHPNVATDFNNLGLVLRAQGNLDGAKKLFERTLKIDETVYGPDHPEVARTLGNLGLILMAMDDLEGAKVYYERALKIFEEVYDPYHPYVAMVINNLGIVLRDQSDYECAKEYLERALKIEEQAYDPCHPEVFRTVWNLGSVLQDMGDNESAKEYLERALKIEEQVYGQDHSKVAIVATRLGLALQNIGDYDGAKKHFERALKIDETVHGPDHPYMAVDVNNLGRVLKDMGDYKTAQKYLERALKMFEHLYDSDHPYVARIVNNLGIVLQNTGDFAGAKEHYERALKICQSRLGEDHPTTKLVRENLESLRR